LRRYGKIEKKAVGHGKRGGSSANRLTKNGRSHEKDMDQLKGESGEKKEKGPTSTDSCLDPIQKCGKGVFGEKNT